MKKGKELFIPTPPLLVNILTIDQIKTIGDDGLYDREEKDERRFNYLLSIVMIESLKVTNCNIRFHSSSFLELCSGFLLLFFFVDKGTRSYYLKVRTR